MVYFTVLYSVRVFSRQPTAVFEHGYHDEVISSETQTAEVTRA